MTESTNLIRDGSFTAAFDDLVSQTMRRWKVPGLSIAVIDNDTILAKVFLGCILGTAPMLTLSM